MKLKALYHLNIRQKVVVSLSLSIIVIGVIGGLSYHYLANIERKLHFLEIVQDLSNTILEMRRYEKNYLLYGLSEALEENYRYVQHGMDVFDKIKPQVKHLQASPQLNRLEEEFLTYKDLIDKTRGYVRGNIELNFQEVENSLRQTGKTLVNSSEKLVDFERMKILKIVSQLKTQLVVSLLILLFVGGFLIALVGKKIIQPLRVIEDTTVRIARGNFKPLPVLETRDETQRVVEAFNRMVRELERHQDQLVQIKKLSSLGVLTSGVAHQLNNPLNNISTSCQILLEELDQMDMDFIRKMLTNVEQEVHRARDIVKGLLEFSRAKEFSPSPMPLRDVVERSVRLISSQVPSGIEIIREVPEDLILHLDSQKMQQVFLNLFMNAIYAIKEPPGRIVVNTRVNREKQEAVICVEDTGVGIPEEDLGAIFDPFFTTKEVGIGTGLGLSIAYGIIEKHQGSISVESKVGEGTRFFIKLPVHPDTQEESD